jgi:hypothetical protein
LSYAAFAKAIVLEMTSCGDDKSFDRIEVAYGADFCSFSSLASIFKALWIFSDNLSGKIESFLLISWLF